MNIKKDAYDDGIDQHDFKLVRPGELLRACLRQGAASLKPKAKKLLSPLCIYPAVEYSHLVNMVLDNWDTQFRLSRLHGFEALFGWKTDNYGHRLVSICCRSAYCYRYAQLFGQ
jgi:hypothetical protein